MRRNSRNGLLLDKTIKEQAIMEIEARGAPRHIIEGLRMLDWNAIPRQDGKGIVHLSVDTFRDAYDWEAFIQGLMGIHWDTGKRGNRAMA